jgi:hypothetical protein
MKPRNLGKKLVLSKKTIANLNKGMMEHVMGHGLDSGKYGDNSCNTSVCLTIRAGVGCIPIPCKVPIPN